ncbi:hypothetical protein [Robertmurraya andreesenii]|uniref:Chemotaxis protein CheX n=1 Tax=Anoxybacillus andreesenii TaxID=1325932 RepID=A0ABT9UYE6_9BACL|nr:hypothetical protein [Robertmurraya andreesenii]MDQ0153704.1 hypothetical protein [Robertmurraya andreesenii]
MFSQFFGHYLLNQGLLSREQLTDALEFQQSVHVKFGVIAVDEGFLTPEQVEKVHEMQKQIDKRFGEIAVELGYLTDDQVEAMLSVQKQNHLLLAQALVDRGYMSIEEFSNALNHYKRDFSLSDDKFEAIKRGDIDALVTNILDHKESNTIEKYGNYLTLFAKNMIRFIDDQVYLEVCDHKQNEGNWLVHQDIVGEAPLFTAISAQEDVFLYIASAYAEEELTEVDELAKASVSEFLNLHNGIYLVNMSNEGIELNMNPQEVVESAKVNGEGLLVTVHTSKGKFDLFLSTQPSTVLIEKGEDSQQLV